MNKLGIKMPEQFKIGLMAIGFGLLIGAILIQLTGNDPLSAYGALFSGGLMSVKRVANTFASATPLILTGLSVAFAFRTGLFNIGGAGQMLAGGLSATVVGLKLAPLMEGLPPEISKVLLLSLMFVCAVAGGMLWGFIPGLLKSRFNVHEVVSTIMMNFISLETARAVIQGFLTAGQETQSAKLSSIASLQMGWLRDITSRSFLNFGLVIAIIIVVIISIIINKTVLGYQLKAAGFNRFASEYAGMNVNRNIVLSMVIAGGLAGAAGFTFYCGYSSYMQVGVLPSQGFDGIAVALLGANTPIGAFLSAIFFGLLWAGKGFMQSMTSVPQEISDIIIGSIIYGAATSIIFKNLLRNKVLNRLIIFSLLAIFFLLHIINGGWDILRLVYSLIIIAGLGTFIVLDARTLRSQDGTVK